MFRVGTEHDGNSDEDTEFHNFDDESSTAFVTRKETSATVKSRSRSTATSSTAASASNRTNAGMLEPVADIWGPPTSLYTWTPSDLSGSPSNLTSDAVSAISLSRLLRFEEKKVKLRKSL